MKVASRISSVMIFLARHDSAFGGCFDLVEVFDEVEPLLEGAVGGGDFEGAHGGAAFVRGGCRCEMRCGCDG